MTLDRKTNINSLSGLLHSGALHLVTSALGHSTLCNFSTRMLWTWSLLHWGDLPLVTSALSALPFVTSAMGYAELGLFCTGGLCTRSLLHWGALDLVTFTLGCYELVHMCTGALCTCSLLHFVTPHWGAQNLFASSLTLLLTTWEYMGTVLPTPGT